MVTTSIDQSEKPTTFSFQETLPRLPVPSLKETCEQLLDWNKVLLNESEMAHSRQVVKSFLQPGKAGPKLQERLLQWSQQDELASWLEPFWSEAFLSYRKPLCVNVNVFYQLDPIPKLKGVPFVRSVASILLAIYKVKQLIESCQLEVEMERGQPLCMVQYKKLFTATRIPEKGCDYQRNLYSDNKPTPSVARHIVVFHRGQPYSLELVTDSGQPRSHEAVAEALTAIIKKGAVSDPGYAIGALTTMKRDNWALARKQLQGIHPDNVSALEKIDTALFALCLECEETDDPTDIARVMMHGDGKNRWFDKSFQLIACPNGFYGVNAEHSGLDGSVIGRMLKEITEEPFDYQWQSEAQENCTLEIIQFHLDDSLCAFIQKAEEDFTALINNVQVKVLLFKDFGKNRIKEHGISPDAYVQMALQLAQYRIFGRCNNTYEPVMTRRFLHGRTEAARTVTEESVAFVEAMVSDVSDDYTRTELLQKAAKQHVSRLVKAKSGAGVQRHLFGLQKIYQLYKVELGIDEEPEIFSDPIWTRMCHDTFSTSTSAPMGLALAGFGPVVEDGFGIRYVTKDKSLHFTTSSWAVNSDKLELFTTYIAEALQEIDRVLRTVSGQNV